MYRIILSVLTLLILSVPSDSVAAERPNILFLFSDDHAINAISAYGGPLADVAPTPNIDRIAKDGALFVNSFCANSICGPSRATILTGKHSHINGFYTNAMGTQFDGSQMTFPKLLQKAGYTTAMIGKRAKSSGCRKSGLRKTGERGAMRVSGRIPAAAR